MSRRMLTVDGQKAIRVDLDDDHGTMWTTLIVRDRRVVIVDCYSDPAAFPKLAPAFDTIAKSVRLKPAP